MWQRFCEQFQLAEFANDESLKLNNERVKQRDRIVPVITELFQSMSKQEMMDQLDQAGIPFAPINKPSDLFDDVHMNAGGLVNLTLTGGEHTGEVVKLPALPIEFAGARFGVTQDLPREGEHSRQAAQMAGYSDEEIEQLVADGIIRVE